MPVLLPSPREESETAKAGVLSVRDARRFGLHLQRVVGGKLVPKSKLGAGVATGTGKAKGKKAKKAGKVLGGLRARMKWVLSMLTGRRGIDVRLLRLCDVEVDRAKGQARVRIGDAKLVKRKQALDVTRGRLQWLACSCERDTLDFVSAGVEELRARAKQPNGYMFPFKTCDVTRGYEAYAKIVRQARRTFRCMDGSSCRPADIRTHTPRRTFCTVLHQKNVPLKAIAHFTGHKKMEHLRDYIEIGAEFCAVSHKQLRF